MKLLSVNTQNPTSSNKASGLQLTGTLFEVLTSATSVAEKTRLLELSAALNFVETREDKDLGRPSSSMMSLLTQLGMTGLGRNLQNSSSIRWDSVQS